MCHRDIFAAGRYQSPEEEGSINDIVYEGGPIEEKRGI